MRKIILILSILFCCYNAISQPVVNRSNSSVTSADSRLQATLNLYLPRFLDTTAANLAKGIDSCGSEIYTYTDNKIWIRGCSPKKWIDISGNGTVTGANSGLINNNNVIQLGRLYGDPSTASVFTNNREISLGAIDGNKLIISSDFTPYSPTFPEAKWEFRTATSVFVQSVAGGGIGFVILDSANALGDEGSGVSYFTGFNRTIQNATGMHWTASDKHYFIADMRNQTEYAAIEVNGVSSQNWGTSLNNYITQIGLLGKIVLGQSLSAANTKGDLDNTGSTYLRDSLMYEKQMFITDSAGYNILLAAKSSPYPVKQMSVGALATLLGVTGTPTLQQVLATESNSASIGANTVINGTGSLFNWEFINIGSFGIAANDDIQLVRGTGRYLSLNTNTGSRLSDPDSVKIWTNSNNNPFIKVTTTNVIIPNLTSSIDTATYKPFGIDPATGNTRRMNSWAQVSGGGGSGITIGTTTITSGTDTRVLFDDGGVVGEDGGFVYAKTTDALTIGGIVTGGRFTPTATTATANGLYLPAANTLGLSINGTGEVQLTATAFSPITNDGNAFGTSTLGWADAFFADGAVLSFNNTYTITHSTGLLTFNNAATFSGTVTANNLAMAGSSGLFLTTTTGDNSDLYVIGGTGSRSTNAAALFEGSSGTGFRMLSRGSTSYTLTASDAFADYVIGRQVDIEAGSGTHPMNATLAILAKAITNGAGATTNTASLYIEGAPTGITPTAYANAIYVASGNVRLGAIPASVGGDSILTTNNGVIERIDPASLTGLPYVPVTFGSDVAINAVTYRMDFQVNDMTVRMPTLTDANTGTSTNAFRPYKVYTALLTQSGTSAPVATILENTLGGVPVWTYNTNGDYTATLAGAFVSGKTWFYNQQFMWSNGNGVVWTRNDDDTIEVTFGDDDILNNYSIEVRVYY